MPISQYACLTPLIHPLFLTPKEAVLVLSKSTQYGTKNERHKYSQIASTKSSRQASMPRMKLIAANPNPRITGLDELPGKSNYFIGSDPKKWHTNVPHYARVKYEGVYPGIDLIFYGNQRQLEYDFVVAH